MSSVKQSDTTTIPDDLREALEATPDAYAAFLVMPPSHRGEYLAFIDEAKTSATRARRILRALEMMSQWKVDNAELVERKQSRKITARDKPAKRIVIEGAITERHKSGRRG